MFDEGPLPLSIPFANWFMSVIAAKFIVHLFEGMSTHAGLAGNRDL